jgi:hypothetical protein
VDLAIEGSMIEEGIVAVCAENKIVDVAVELEDNFEVVSDSFEANNFVSDFVLEQGIIDDGVTCKRGPVVVLRVRRMLCD